VTDNILYFMTKITNPNPAASRLPRPRGQVVMTPATPDPVRPLQITKGQALKLDGKSAYSTSGKKSLAETTARELPQRRV
jgi:hypothetical protein